MRAPEFWRGGLRPPALLLRPLGAAYGAVAAARLRRPAPRAALPVIAVGGLTAGGDGKTPLALALAARQKALGERPVILTRGYGRAPGGPAEPFVVEPARHTAREAGDEALLLARVAPTIVAADRAAAARLAQEIGATILVLDDGLLSRRLAPDLALLAVDSHYGAGNGLCLPAGPLRAPLAAQIGAADALVLIGGGRAAAPLAALAAAHGKPVIRAFLKPDPASAARLKGRRIFAFAGIARPEKFARSLVEIGGQVVGSRWFGDHHRYSRGEIEDLVANAVKANATLATTEKDAARIGLDSIGEAAVETLKVSLVFDRPEETDALLARALKSRLNPAV